MIQTRCEIVFHIYQPKTSFSKNLAIKKTALFPEQKKAVESNSSINTYFAATSVGRNFTASLSSTPLTYLWPSIPPNDLVNSTASLMTTR